jgi:ribosomal protein S18 acetylase RimI-like enzyme
MPLALVPMTAADYDSWLEEVVPRYAADKVANGTWSPADAPTLSRTAIAALLPQGRETPGQYLRSLAEQPGGRKVGSLWFGRQDEAAYLYDLVVHPQYRRKGFGRQAMGCLEQAAAALGFRSIKLHVFGQAEAARALYASLGYAVTDLNLRKDLPAQS